MTDAEIAAAVDLLAKAWRENRRIPALNATPSLAEAHAIQDKVAALLGETIGGFKANAPRDAAPVRGAIYARSIFPNASRVAPALVPDLAVEGEIAFRFLRDLPAREREYSRAEVTAALAALPAVEVVSGRLMDWRSRPAEEQLADCLNNGALVTGPERADWPELEIDNLPVTAWVNGAVVWQGRGGHPSGDPLGVAVALANMRRAEGGIVAGQLVTTGSCTGLRSLAPGDRFAVEFTGLGRAELEFAPA